MISANILILNSKNKFLLQKRDNNKNIKSPDHWCLFGGKTKKRERPIRCIVREIKEELNIKINNPKFLTRISYSYKNKIKANEKYFYFKILNRSQIKKMTLLEGQKMKFFRYQDIFKIKKVIPWDFYAILYYFKYFKNK